MSAIVSGKLRLRLTTVDLAAVVRSAIEVVRPAAEAKRIELRAAFAPRLLMVGDADRLRQVAWNLLSNAVKFSNQGAVVDVRIERDASQLVLTVADTGVGIAPEFLPHLFERFRQADSSTTRERAGLGLGLAIVRHMVELHGGTVSAESGGTNRGATFRVMLPVRAVATDSSPSLPGRIAVSEGDAVEAPVSLDGVRVLVVDDEADALALVEAVLTEARRRACGSRRPRRTRFTRFGPGVPTCWSRTSGCRWRTGIRCSGGSGRSRRPRAGRYRRPP